MTERPHTPASASHFTALFPTHRMAGSNPKNSQPRLTPITTLTYRSSRASRCQVQLSHSSTDAQSLTGKKKKRRHLTGPSGFPRPRKPHFTPPPSIYKNLPSHSLSSFPHPSHQPTPLHFPFKYPQAKMLVQEATTNIPPTAFSLCARDTMTPPPPPAVEPRRYGYCLDDDEGDGGSTGSLYD